MDAHPHPTGPAPSRTRHSSETGTPRWIRRTLLIAGGVCVFALVGSIISPSWSEAGDGARMKVDGGGGAARPRSMPIVAPATLIGTLEGREYRILIHHAEGEPRYTVCSPDGRVLREDLLADDIYREFPDLDLRRLHLDPPNRDGSGPLMLIYPLD